MLMQEYYTEHYVKVAQIAYRVAKEALRGYKHPKSPNHFTLPQLAACLLIQFYFGFDFRQMVKWLLANEGVCRVLELSQVPDQTTLYRTVKLLRIAEWERLKFLLWKETKEAKECTPTRIPSRP